tara:strand:+ start:4223 stop:4855 length:633 start_codon:yes stop_codon:yes gene_type:complete
MGFNKFHVDHIKEFFDEKTAATIYKELDSLQYELISQERHGHYGHVFKSEDPNMPDDSESYAAKFNLATDRDGSISFNNQFKNMVVPLLKKNFPSLRFFLKPNIMRINKDCYFRAHNDQYAGKVGYTFFFSSGWKWDYGGILTFVTKEGAYPVFPENNSFLIRDEEARPQHYVGPVGLWAKDKYYYLLVGWASSEDPGDSDVRGAYYDFG